MTSLRLLFGWKAAPRVALVLVVMVAPLLLGGRGITLHLLVLAGIYWVVAMGLMLIFGLAGQLSLAHAAFFGIGAYTSALLSTRLDVPVMLAFVAATVVAAVVSWIIARPVFRLRGFYLAMATLAFAEITVTVFEQEVWLTGGPTGILALPPPALGPIVFGRASSYYYLVWVVALASAWVTRNIIQSRLGRGLRAIASSEVGATTSGINIAVYKTWMFVLGGAFAGLAGALYVHYATLINPDNFSIDFAILIVMMLAVGGMDTLLGTFLGAAFLVTVPTVLARYPRYSQLLFGVLFLLVVALMPKGLAGVLHAGRQLLRRWWPRAARAQ